MLYFLLKNSIHFLLFSMILNTAYYTCIGTGLAVAATLICRRLEGLGYRRREVVLPFCIQSVSPA